MECGGGGSDIPAPAEVTFEKGAVTATVTVGGGLHTAPPFLTWDCNTSRPLGHCSLGSSYCATGPGLTGAAHVFWLSFRNLAALSMALLTNSELGTGLFMDIKKLFTS